MAGELYFSERESGVPLPEREAISAEFWAGFVALVHRLIAEGRLAERFPAYFCPDMPTAVTGCNPDAVGLAFRGDNPGIAWPLQPDVVPDTLRALDTVEFFYRLVSEPRERIRHDYFAHEHFIGFNSHRARSEYITDVNRILRRNRHPYELQTDGRIARLAPSVLREMLSQGVFNTGDAELDGLLETAREKFLSPDLKTRRESLEKLWDAWERLKTVENSETTTSRLATWE